MYNFNIFTWNNASENYFHETTKRNCSEREKKQLQFRYEFREKKLQWRPQIDVKTKCIRYEGVIFSPHFPCGCRSLHETFNCEGGNNEIRMPFLSREIWGHISSLTAFAKTNSDAAINWKNVKRGMLERKLVFMNVCNYFVTPSYGKFLQLSGLTAE